MQLSRQEVVDLLRQAGLPEEAGKAAEELPDPVDFEYVQEWGLQHGITRDVLISQMGSSP